MHVETPTYTREDMCPSRQPGWQSVDGGFFPALHHPADAPLRINPVQASIFVAGVLSPNLGIGFHAPEVPINIVRRANIGTHGVILL